MYRVMETCSSCAAYVPAANMEYHNSKVHGVGNFNNLNSNPLHPNVLRFTEEPGFQGRVWPYQSCDYVQSMCAPCSRDRQGAGLMSTEPRAQSQPQPPESMSTVLQSLQTGATTLNARHPSVSSITYTSAVGCECEKLHQCWRKECEKTERLKGQIAILKSDLAVAEETISELREKLVQIGDGESEKPIAQWVFVAAQLDPLKYFGLMTSASNGYWRILQRVGADDLPGTSANAGSVTQVPDSTQQTTTTQGQGGFGYVTYSFTQ